MRPKPPAGIGQRPIRFSTAMLRTCGIIAVVEVAVMLLLSLAGLRASAWLSLADGVLLSLLSAPALYRWVIRPSRLREQTLRENEERFRLVVESVPSAILLVDHAGNITFANSQVARLFGYAPEELIGQSVELLVPERFRHTHPSYAKAFFAHAKPRVLGAGRILLARRKDGTEIPFEIGLNPMETPEGARVLAVLIDITDRKRNEAMLVENISELERFKHVTVDRENRMIELKREVNDLSQALGRPAPYDVSFEALKRSLPSSG
ncbi:MAG: PAS domain S-box protein [Candidatus Omnitrophica bacterium]|nr:PAS domain S-box protein [Candidatus Omnitrophota bacterium]